MGDDIWEHYAKEYQAREARWEPVRSGVPYTCNECPALVEMRAQRDRWKQLAITDHLDVCNLDDHELCLSYLEWKANKAVRGE